MMSSAVDASDPVDVARWLRAIAAELMATELLAQPGGTAGALNLQVLNDRDLEDVVSEAAGVAAWYVEHPDATPAQVAKTITRALASMGKRELRRGSP
jgi:hypothetical protein